MTNRWLRSARWGVQGRSLSDFRKVSPLRVDGNWLTSYPAPLCLSENLVAGLGSVDDSMQDARNAGVCLTLKVHVQTLQRALGFLINDLSNHAWECRRERIHAFSTAKRHRKAIDEAIQRFLRMTGQIPVADDRESSVKLQSLDRIADFYKRLPLILPALDFSNCPQPIGVVTSSPEDWRKRLVDSAEQLESLSGELGPLKAELDAILVEKSRICREIEGSMRKMAGTL